jgi:membrane protease YdiL (CAAX protease family)
MSASDTPMMPGLAAAGTLGRARAQRLNGRRARLVTELVLLYVVAPLLIAYATRVLHVKMFFLMFPVVVGFVVYFLIDRSFSPRDELIRGFGRRTLVEILAVFLVVGSAMSAWFWLNRPAVFLAFPKYLPLFWAMVLVAYPLFSALPQEIAYRTFFFHRYGPLFGTRRWLAIAVNAIVFGLAHVIFLHVASVVLSAALGALLAYRYTETRSLWAVWLEHSLYGLMAFTIGLGRYFVLHVPAFVHAPIF